MRKQSPAAVENLTRRDAHANEKARQAFLSYVMRECGVLNKRDFARFLCPERPRVISDLARHGPRIRRQPLNFFQGERRPV